MCRPGGVSLGQVGMSGDNVHFRICGQSWKHTELGLCSKPPLFPMLPSQSCQATGSPTLASVTNHHPVHQSSSSPTHFPCPAEANHSPVASACSFLVALAPQGYTQDSRERGPVASDPLLCAVGQQELNLSLGSWITSPPGDFIYGPRKSSFR